MIYFKLPLLSLLLMSMVSFSHHALAVDCESIITTTNKKLSWTILDNNGTKIATGRIIVSKVTEDGYFETRHSAGNNPAMSFYGGFNGTNMMYLNPDYEELWIGKCIGNKIVGTVKDSKFEITTP
jgi:hypothetical protein